jgi:hypothetical protein
MEKAEGTAEAEGREKERWKALAATIDGDLEDFIVRTWMKRSTCPGKWPWS